MPLWLLKLLPYGAAVLGLAFAVWFIDHRGYERAEAQNKALEQKLDLQAAKTDLTLNGEVEDVQNTLTASMNKLGGDLGNRIDSIDATNKTIIQPTITKEIAGAPILTSTTCALPDGLWGSINQARRLGQASDTPVTGSTGSQGVPVTQPAQ